MMEKRSTSPGWGTVLNGQAQWKEHRSSVQGLREFWLRVDLATHSEKPTLAVQALNVAVGFQHNMYIQPRLLPGENPLWVEAAELADGAKLRAEWIYQLDGQERRAAVELAKAGRAAEGVVIEADCPSDVHTTGIRLSCL